MDEKWQDAWDELSVLERRVLLFVHEKGPIDEDIIAEALMADLYLVKNAVDNLMSKKLIGNRNG